MDVKCVSLFEDNPWLIIQLQNYLSMTVTLASTCYAGYRRIQLCFKVKRKLLEHHIITDNNHASISSHLHSEIGKNCWHSRAANHIRISSLPRDSSLITVRNLDANYFRSHIKKIKKYKQAMTKNPDLACSFIICLQNGNLLEVISPFIHEKYTEITYFSFKGLPALIPGVIFIFFT